MGLNGKLIKIPLGSEVFHKEFERHLLLVYVGKPHFSGANNWELFKRHIDGDQEIVEFFEKLKENAIAMKAALQQEDIYRISEVLNDDWQTRKAMLPGMTTPEIERLTFESFKIGAFALRVCGAGGGGCVALLIDPAKRDELEDFVKRANMQILPSNIADDGIRVSEEFQ
ncbi:MAG: hypothetical protein HYW90_04570 [Candidatus Sungbacteria bacterium]|nr:hypothetical protein [Candidatus Sungbacteria bacterium]